MNKQTITALIVIAVIAIVMIGFVDFGPSNSDDGSENGTAAELDENEQGYINLEDSDDDFAAIDDALNALDG